jgi:glycosyltransferase involved in cell wall biosynthesis/peptidoglycan/xylan/chitin deacetylase (PgdA/CDA1 family)
MGARPLILSYHAVSGTWPSRLAIAPHVLREQLGRLARLGFEGFTISELERRREDGSLPERALAVTFDDGYASSLRADALLAEFGFPGTIFVVTSYTESQEKLLWPGLEMWNGTEHAHELQPASWSTLERLASTGWEVGSHTVTHRLLTSLPQDTLDRELRLSRETIVAHLGACTSLAYPYGVPDRRVEEAAERAGYDVACTLAFSHQRDEKFSRPRFELRTRDNGVRLMLQLSVARPIRRTGAAPLVRRLRFGPHWLPSNAGEGLETSSNDATVAAAGDRNDRRPPQRAPLATVLMCVRNGERYVQRAINSVLTQTMENFELVIVDDASTDGTYDLLQRINDPRVLVTQLPEQAGAAQARNLGLSTARGTYVAILDADDVALPRRLEQQIAFLAEGPRIAIVGSPAVVIDADGIPRGVRSMPGGPLLIRWTAMLKSPFAHSSVVFRADVLKRFDLVYDRAFEPSEDYDLCARVLAVGNGENMDDPLVFYRVHPDQLSNTKRERQLRLHEAIVRRTIREELPEFHADDVQLSELWRLFSGIRVDPVHHIALGHLYLDLFDAFRAKYRGYPDLDAVTRSVVQAVMFRCFIPPQVAAWGDLARRLLAVDPVAPVLFPLAASTLAMRRTLWCWSPRIRRNAKLATFAVAPPGPAVAAAAAPPRTAEADPQQLERLQ